MSLWGLWRKERAKLAQARRREKIARAFNNEYTYLHRHEPTGHHAWMCRECNRIHAPVELSLMTGLHYPGCCSSPCGHRLDHGIRMWP